MSRTLRRNKPHLITSYVGPRDEFCEDPWRLTEARRDGLSVESLYVRKCRHYTRDRRRGMFGVPAWYRREHGAYLVRRRERVALHQHLRNDTWDVHQPDDRFRDSMYYWWY
jgi:hypothetical protein